MGSRCPPTRSLTEDEQQWAEQFITNYLAQVVPADSAINALMTLTRLTTMRIIPRAPAPACPVNIKSGSHDSN